MASTDPVREAIAEHLASRRVSRVLHGSIIALALIVALEHHPPRPGAVAATLLATAVAIALAELYGEIVGTETRTRARVGRSQIRGMAAEIGATAAGIAFPAIFFLLAALGAFDRDTAFDIAKWSGLGLITAYGFAAARLTGDTFSGSLRRAALAGLIAAFLIGIKAALH